MVKEKGKCWREWKGGGCGCVRRCPKVLALPKRDKRGLLGGDALVMQARGNSVRSQHNSPGVNGGD